MNRAITFENCGRELRGAWACGASVKFKSLELLVMRRWT
jgi:hypothetical protein